MNPDAGATTIGEVGEKRLLKEVLLPLVNPTGDPFLAGDDCGIVEVPDGHYLCASTDRVPWDLTGYRLGIMSDHDLGYYLAVLNISDIAAMGATPVGLLLNFALPRQFQITRLVDLARGVLAASAHYETPVLGGDLSDSSEPSLSATSLGIGSRGKYLHRSGAVVGDAVFTTAPCGLAATAFRYFLEAKPSGMVLSRDDEHLLRQQFIRPSPRLNVGRALVSHGTRATAMDNSDGLSQSLFELADASSKHFVIQEDLLPIHPLSRKVSAYLDEAPLEFIMGPGADFNLVGTVCSNSAMSQLGLHKIGVVEQGNGLSVQSDRGRRDLEPRGWNYFLEAEGR